MLRKLGIAAGIAFGSILVAFLLSELSFFKTLEWKIYDVEIRTLRNRPDLASRDIVMVNIDDVSLARMEENGYGRFPWPRDTYRPALDFLARSHPKVVTFDILFLEKTLNKLIDDSGVRKVTGEQADQELIDGTKQLGNVIHAVEISDVTHDEGDPAGQGH